MDKSVVLTFVSRETLERPGSSPAASGFQRGDGCLHRGIPTGGFERRFDLADRIRVAGAALDKGLLHIDLAREVPEALKPRTIAIDSGGRKRIDRKVL